MNNVNIIIPALNEQDGITETITKLPLKKINDLGYTVSILVVDGGSTDQTRENAAKLGAKIITEERRGYGRAYKTALQHADGNIIITLDADATYPSEKIPQYISELVSQDLDYITINRLAGLEKKSMSLSHFVGNKVLSLVLRVLYSINVKDSQSGMWIMRRQFCNSINPISDGMSFSEEIKIIAFKFFKSKEIDGTYYPRVGRPSTFRIRKEGIENLVFLFRFRFLLKNTCRLSKIVQ
jgi:glycosyltransferase involved in cell wall biosynthesis